MSLPVEIVKLTPCQASVSTLKCALEKVVSAKDGWNLSLGSRRNPSYWPWRIPVSSTLRSNSSLARLRSAAAVAGSTKASARTCRRWLWIMSRTWPTPSKNSPRPSRPRSSYCVTRTSSKECLSQETPSRCRTMSWKTGRFLTMKNDNQWSTRCRLLSWRPDFMMSLWSSSALRRLVPKGFSAARCTRPVPQLSTAQVAQAAKTEGGTLRYKVK
mmetsp:Transcript_111897/g.311466  ORF Transcript_111897/g.311466 Transcript_111897/m.311466 type:complete len:214 (+) Transcript_111897:634-1275(+)